ncbi:hypothetical protein [Kutzneria sp. NPDC051319]|uniref:hypothetical protein n=1 Tax=Kutzneria sp. NPDC051319 TaxID=3155047 RepID=UPI00343D0814
MTTAAAAAELVLLVAAVPFGDGEISGTFTVGGVIGLLAVVPWAGMCVLAVLSRHLSAAQRLFVTAAVITAALTGSTVVLLRRS